MGALSQDYGTYSMATDILCLLSHVVSMDASILLTHLHAEALMGVRGGGEGRGKEEGERVLETHCSEGWFSFEESCVLTIPGGG